MICIPQKNARAFIVNYQFLGKTSTTFIFWRDTLELWPHLGVLHLCSVKLASLMVRTASDYLMESPSPPTTPVPPLTFYSPLQTHNPHLTHFLHQTVLLSPIPCVWYYKESLRVVVLSVKVVLRISVVLLVDNTQTKRAFSETGGPSHTPGWPRDS